MGALNAIAASASTNPPAGWREPAALTLDERGMIRDCSRTGEELFGYSRVELTWRHVSKLLPQLSEIDLIQEGQINPLLSFLCHCGQLFEVNSKDGATFPGELNIINLGHPGKLMLRMIVRPAGGVGVSFLGGVAP